MLGLLAATEAATAAADAQVAHLWGLAARRGAAAAPALAMLGEAWGLEAQAEGRFEEEAEAAVPVGGAGEARRGAARGADGAPPAPAAALAGADPCTAAPAAAEHESEGAARTRELLSRTLLGWEGAEACGERIQAAKRKVASLMAHLADGQRRLAAARRRAAALGRLLAAGPGNGGEEAAAAVLGAARSGPAAPHSAPASAGA